VFSGWSVDYIEISICRLLRRILWISKFIWRFLSHCAVILKECAFYRASRKQAVEEYRIASVVLKVYTTFISHILYTRIQAIAGFHLAGLASVRAWMYDTHYLQSDCTISTTNECKIVRSLYIDAHHLHDPNNSQISYNLLEPLQLSLLHQVVLLQDNAQSKLLALSSPRRYLLDPF